MMRKAALALALLLTACNPQPTLTAQRTPDRTPTTITSVDGSYSIKQAITLEHLASSFPLSPFGVTFSDGANGYLLPFCEVGYVDGHPQLNRNHQVVIFEQVTPTQEYLYALEYDFTKDPPLKKTYNLEGWGISAFVGDDRVSRRLYYQGTKRAPLNQTEMLPEAQPPDDLLPYLESLTGILAP